MLFKNKEVFDESFTPNESGYVIADKTKIHYETYGEGIPLIMLHGNGQSTAFFHQQLLFFKDYFYVVLVDTRGHGESDFGKKKLSLTLLTKDIEILINELHLYETCILGFSDGANIAIKLAELLPEKIIAIVTVSPNLNPSGLKGGVRFLIKLAYYFSKFFKKIEWFNKKNQVLSLMISEVTTTKNNLKSIKVPVLVIAGQYDIIHYKHIEMIANLIPDSQLAIISHGGHNSLHTHSSIVNDKIYNFLKPYLD